MFNTGGYQSSQPLNLNNNTLFNPNPNQNQNVFGGNNQTLGFSGYQNPIMVDPAFNIQQWISDTANRILLNLFNSGRITRDLANYIGHEISNNMQTCINTLARGTNNFTNTNAQNMTNIIGQIIEYIAENKYKSDMAMYNNNIASMNSAAMLSNAAGVNNCEYNINIPQNTQSNNSINYNGTPTRKAKFKTNRQIQQYANAVASTPAPNNNNVPKENNIISKPIVENNVEQNKLNDTFLINTDTNGPIQTFQDYLIKFDPKNVKTWPAELVNQFLTFDKTITDETIKKYLCHCAICETYWNSKGIIWKISDSLELSRFAKQKYEKRKENPVTRDTTTTQKEYGKDGYEVTINNLPFMNCKTEIIDLITLSQNNTPIANLMFAYLIKDDVVVNETEFIDECTNGQINNIKLTKQNEVILDVIKEQRNVALAIDYEITVGVDIPYDIFKDYYKQFSDIVIKYRHIFNDKHLSKENCNKYIREFIRCLYSMPRKWSERIDKFITKYLNEAAMRHMKHITNGYSRAPHFNSFINIIDIFDGEGYNVFNYDCDFSKKFYILIHQVLSSIFTGLLFNPDAETDLNILINSKESKDLLCKYHGDDVTYKDIIDWKKDTDTYETKLERLKKHLNKYSVISISKTILITDIMPDKKYAQNKDIWTMYPMDNHLSPFEYIVVKTFDCDNIFIDAIIITSDTKIKLIKPIAYYKLNHTFDNYVGKMLVDY